MASSGSSSGEIFDLRKIRRLAELMKEHDLAEVDLRQADQRLRVRRGVPLSGAPGPFPPQPAAASSHGQSAAAGAASSRAEDGEHIGMIKSPMVGTFYLSPNPESPPFVKVGDHVGPETTVCIIEAMKVFNELPAEISGQIVAVLVDNGEPVEFGQPLF